jgi:hypothetical protein
MKIIPAYSAVSTDFKKVLRGDDINIAMKYLLHTYICAWGFDEAWYLEANPDLKSAIPSNDFPSGFAHFLAVGYMEGRLPLRAHVDSTWYMANYPDISAAIIRGIFESAAHHFSTVGYREGRLPSDPEIDTDWYIRAYLPSAEFSADKSVECLHHFMNIGYLNGALPRQKLP